MNKILFVLLTVIVALIVLLCVSSCKKEDRCHTCTIVKPWGQNTGKTETFCGKDKDFEAWKKENATQNKIMEQCQ